ncbi:MAG: glutamate racemase [Sphingomicrobium sp.]
METNAPILFFDSGVGGLSVLGPTRALLPTAPIVYAADNAWFPYGKRSEADLAARVPEVLAALAAEHHPRLIVIACNTASTIALDQARAALDVPIVGTVPAIKPAAERSRSRIIGVLGTEATVRQPYVDDLAGRFASDCTILRHGSPELVELAEAKLRGKVVDPAAVVAAVRPMVEAGPDMDVMVLACTHFPLLGEEIADAFPSIAQVDGATGIARRIAHLTRGQSWPETAPPGIAVFTAPPDAALTKALARFGLTRILRLAI